MWQGKKDVGEIQQNLFVEEKLAPHKQIIITLLLQPKLFDRGYMQGFPKELLNH